MGMMDWLFGSDEVAPRPPPGPAKFGPSRPFPSSEDAAFARKYGEFDPGTYSSNTYQASGADLPFNQYLTGSNEDIVGLRTLAEQGKLQQPSDPALLDILARNKLAARRSAIASLGTSNTGDLVMAGMDFGIPDNYGITARQRKHPLFTFVGGEAIGQSTPSTFTHEAAHRGLYNVMDEIGRMPQTPEMTDLRNTIGNDQELMVRLLMQRLYNNPEGDRLPTEYDYFLNDPGAAADRNRISRANELAEGIAARMIQQRQPGGPR